MVLHVLRGLFVLLMAAVSWGFLGRNNTDAQFLGQWTWLSIAISVALGVLVVCIDIVSPRRKLQDLAGTFFGLMVGLVITSAVVYVLQLVFDQLESAKVFGALSPDNLLTLRKFIISLSGVIACYLSISFVLQTKDDVRFIIPYVEFSKQTKGARPILLDTSVLIDGRIDDIASSGILESQLVVPKFVVVELQHVADSADKLKRNRGRRGLDVLARLRANRRVETVMYDSTRDTEPRMDVDQRLLLMAKELNARVLTNDFNLNKVAQLSDVTVININDLASALRPVVLPGEKMTVRMQKPGEESGQGVGYLEDGTMVVVEQGRAHLNEEIDFAVTNVVQTSAGRMIFGRMLGLAAGAQVPPPTARPPVGGTTPARGGKGSDLTTPRT